MTSISFEYFPPKTSEQRAVFLESHEQLKQLNPDYFSVTFGAGGSTLEHTEETVLEINQDPDQHVAPHISCLGGRAESVRKLLNAYRDAGVSRIVALRGDMPSGMAIGGEFRHANELVQFIRDETGDHFRIHVACYPEFHPEAETAERDLAHFRRKVEAGADEAITQYFFNADAYFRFVDDVRALGVEIPIVAGIMPIINYTQLARFSDMCGAEMPRWIRSRLRDFGDDRASIRSFGIDVITSLCQRLIDGGAPGLHFYTLNRATAARRICANLGLGG
ncbi:MAG: methylenetetrahydrofolate reductase [NAD(P)H] [Xanthomonadales bacterium]|nr:methylenetetrahydrofolate reductase [NAD(P)H] [Xanthomonadales bacterium]